MSFKKYSTELQSNSLSASQLVADLFSKVDAHDDKIQAFIDIDRNYAERLAEESDARRATGKQLSAYDGIPIAVKDNILIEGQVSQCASKILGGYRSPYSATAIEKLLAQGFIPYGRLNMDEFAMGSSTENSSLQTTRNPHDITRTPGGSSGGSAAAVAASMAIAALGSDTGGSIRQPASFCGVVGLKPTYGTVSRYGLVAFGSSLDQIGPLTATVADAEILFNIIKGKDPRDSTSVAGKDKVEEKAIKDFVIGIDKALIEQCDEATQKSFTDVLQKLKEHCTIKDISLTHQKYATPVYYLTATSEASANLARFDGVRYGVRSQNSDDLLSLYENSRNEGFGNEVKRRILLGTFALSSGFYDAYYGKAQKVRRLIQNDYLEAFKEVDVIASPVTPSAAFKIGEKTENPLEMYLSDLLTVGASLAGIPALSVPGPSDGLPIGIQLQGPFFHEQNLFTIARLIEKTFPVKILEL